MSAGSSAAATNLWILISTSATDPQGMRIKL
jgi:hypothetical protein